MNALKAENYQEAGKEHGYMAYQRVVESLTGDFKRRRGIQLDYRHDDKAPVDAPYVGVGLVQGLNFW